MVIRGKNPVGSVFYTDTSMWCVTLGPVLVLMLFDIFIHDLGAGADVNPDDTKP